MQLAAEAEPLRPIGPRSSTERTENKRPKPASGRDRVLVGEIRAAEGFRIAKKSDLKANFCLRVCMFTSHSRDCIVVNSNISASFLILFFRDTDNFLTPFIVVVVCGFKCKIIPLAEASDSKLVIARVFMEIMSIVC